MQDKVMTDGRPWKFDKAVAECFTDMLERSIPEYETMRDLVFRVGRGFVKPKTAIIDLGCSSGIASEPFVERFGIQNKFMMYDVSEPMLDECRSRYSSWLKQKTGTVTVANVDITGDIRQLFDVSLVLSVLTVQFTPIENRTRTLQNIYDCLMPGGAFIFVEKVLGNCAETDSLFVSEYHEIKREHEYTNEQIIDKRESLSGVLVPVSAEYNESMLASCGYKHIECFWRYLNFCAWVAIK